MEWGVVTAGEKEFHVWHLYGLRPFPGEAAMARLRAELPDRIRPWMAAGLPHCEHEGRRADCMSCLGFVLRALFPGRGTSAPALPGDWPAGTAGRYTTRDLLLYLTGMTHLPTREARLQRLARQPLPAALRDDLEHLVYAMSAFEAATGNAGTPPRPGQKQPGSPPPRTGIRPGQRRRL
jgi:hypothetical protein